MGTLVADWQSDGCTGAAWTAEPCADPDWQRDGCDPLNEWEDDTLAEDVIVLASSAVITHKSGRAGVQYGEDIVVFTTSANLITGTNPAGVLVGEDIFVVATSTQFLIGTNPAIVDIPLPPTACPTDTLWTFDTEGQGLEAADRIGARVQVASDAESMVTASWSDQNLVHVYERSGNTWVQRSEVAEAPEDPIQGGGQAFGTDISLCEVQGILAIGSPRADISGLALSGGAIDIYTGNNTAGWTWNNRVVTSNLSNDYHLGTGVAISKDGGIMISTMPGASGFNTYTYGGGASYTFDAFRSYPDATSYSGSPNGVRLSDDGQVAFIGDVDYGVGSQGRVLIYDRSGSSWTLRQEIPRPAYGDIGAPGTGVPSNSHKFGQGLAITSDLKNLLATIPQYADDSVNSNGMICFYLLNEGTNLYEFCSYITGDKGPYGWGGGIDLLFNDEFKFLYTGKTDDEVNGANSPGNVYEYIGT